VTIAFRHGGTADYNSGVAALHATADKNAGLATQARAAADAERACSLPRRPGARRGHRSSLGPMRTGTRSGEPARLDCLKRRRRARGCTARARRAAGIERQLSAWELAAGVVAQLVEVALFLITPVGQVPVRSWKCVRVTVAPGTGGARRGHVIMRSSVPRVRDPGGCV